jgi:hypothetical protein
MGDNHFSRWHRSEEPRVRHTSGDDIQYLLRAEEQLLQAIAGRVPLPELLQRICAALDSEIGNVISLVALPDDDAAGLGGIARSANLFRLYKFCSARVEDGDGETLGSLEMYCSVARRPFLGEVQLIERATCLAAVAIKRQKERDAVAAGSSAPASSISGP